MLNTHTNKPLFSIYYQYRIGCFVVAVLLLQSSLLYITQTSPAQVLGPGLGQQIKIFDT